ncbi:MAG TPA: hypothetical protein VGO58_02890 [Chitinophagaceae bacterium]|jgi:hypothetical protein|nr:hypothetical protein [Chitinophagaceae bacterium]
MKLLIISLLLFVFTGDSVAQGKYAGTKKAMIGKVYTEAKNLTALKGWTFVNGGLANSPDDPERIVSDIFKKGTTYLVFFSIMEDTASGKYKVMDVAEITGVAKGWGVHGSSCRQNERENNYIIAWGKGDSEQYMKIIKKAWRFNPDKRRFEAIPVKGVDCEYIGC